MCIETTLYCELLTPEQVIQLATPTYKLRKEKAKSKDTLIDPSTVTIVAQVESQVTEPAISSHNSSVELALPEGRDVIASFSFGAFYKVVYFLLTI